VTKPTKPLPISKIIEELKDADTPLEPTYVYHLSDLEGSDLEQLAAVWPSLPEWRRRAIMEELDELGGEDTLLCFETIGRMALSDEDARVRELAVRVLWEYDNNTVINPFLALLEKDESVEVRAVAATGLGSYIFKGEVDELNPETTKKIVDRLLKIYHSDAPKLVRRKCLEALGFSSQDEMLPILEDRYYSEDPQWIASALYAMGRSANAKWIPLVEAMLEHDNPEIVVEAARAAGELESHTAVPRLVELLNDDDDEVKFTAVWSLSQIGGEGVREILEQLYDEAEDEEDMDLISDALDNLTFTEDMADFALLNLDEADLDELVEEDNLDLFEENPDEDAPD
jgi:HEAT repeat protein